MKFNIILLVLAVSIADPCDQKSYLDCINVVGAQCRYFEDLNRCFPSYSTDLGCLIGLSRENCLSQQEKCAFVRKCEPVTNYMLQRLACTNRLLTRSACLNLQSASCTWNLEQCQPYDIQPLDGVLCKASYMYTYLSPPLCSRIPNEICWHDGESCQDARDKLNNIPCTQPGLSQAACRLITTLDEKCIFDKVCRAIKLQEIPTLKCDNAINKATCLIVQKEPCQWLDSKCQLSNLQLDCRQLTQVNEFTCSSAKGECKFNAAEFRCELADIAKVTQCNTIGLSYQSCMSLQLSCIYIDKQCKAMLAPQQQICSGYGKLNKIACLSITTVGQVCHWDGKECLDYSAKINQDTTCLSLKDVNGNACQIVVKDTCKFNPQTQSCVQTDDWDQCTTESINVKGCIFVSTPDQACQWQESKCKPKSVIPLKTKCTELTNSNAIACSQVDNNNDSDFTCLFDPIWQGCRHFKVGEANTIKCGDISKGLNRYACALVTTPGQACHFSQRRCAAYPIQSLSLPCMTLIYANAATCALSTYDQNLCRHDPQFFSCSPYLNIKNIGCDIGLNSFGCMAVVKEKCSYDKSVGICLKFDSVNIPYPTCSENLPNKDLCLNLTTIGQNCNWQEKLSQCTQFNPDSTKVCSMYTNVNPNTCTVVEVLDPTQNNGEGFCIHNKEDSKCMSIGSQYSCPPDDPCCNKVLGINIHVCSAYTDPNTLCYFTNTRCVQFIQYGAPTQQQKLLAIQEYTRLKLHCHAVNYTGCGSINHNRKLLCFMSNSRDRCHSLTEKEFNETGNYLIFTQGTVRANMWICRKITVANLYIAYDEIENRCKVLTRENNIIRCEEPNINSEACRNLTPEDYCVWVPETLTCNTIPDDELKNYGCDTLINETACVEKQGQCMYNRTLGKCQTMATMDQNKDCTFYAGGQFTYSPEICAMITKTGQACNYSYATLQCQTQIVIQSTCDNIGFNISSCLGFTSSLCQWDAINNKCVTVAQDKVDTFNCNDNINKSVCLKTQTKSCFWDVGAIKCQPENYNAATTCQALMKTGKQFSVKACTQITYPGSICSYDEANMKCTDTGFTTSEKCDIIANIHLCLGRTQYSYCQYDSITNVCSNFLNTRNDLKCSEYPNINRDVCVQKTKEMCRFDLSKSVCEIHASFSNATKCSALFKSGGYLYSRQLCIAVSETVGIFMEPSFTYCQVKTACQNEQYCQYSVEEQACSWVNFGEQVQQDIDCLVKQKTFATCDINFSKAACLQLISASCSFNLAKGGCIPMDDMEASTVSRCEDISASGCANITTLNLTCYVRTVYVLSACDIPMASYKVCSNISMLNYYRENTDKTQCNYWYQTSGYIINANVCSAATSGLCDYDYPNSCCKQLYNSSTNCTISGLSKQACSYPCTYSNNRCGTYSNTSTSECKDFYELKQTTNKYTGQITIHQTQSSLEQNQTNCSLKNSSCGWRLAQVQPDQKQYNQNDCESCYTTAKSTQSNANSTCTNTRTSQYATCVTNTNYSNYYNCITQCVYQENNCKNSCYNTATTCKSGCQPVSTYNSTTNTTTVSKTPAQVEACELECSQTESTCKGYCIQCEVCPCWTIADDKYQTCTNAADSKKAQDDEVCLKQQIGCQYKYNQCDTVETNDCNTIKSEYLYVSKSKCLSSTGSDCEYKYNYKCATPAYTSCYQLNETACLNNSMQLRCAWENNQCQVVSYVRLRSISDCTTVNAYACPYVGQPCIIINQKCLQTQLSLTCGQSASVSSLTCSMLINSQVCYFNTNTNTCTQYSGTDQKFACTQLGLNKLGCLINTKGKCYYENACKDLLIFIDQDCTVLNYNACLAHPSKPCVWNANACNNIAYSSGTQTCSSFIANSIPSTFVNEISCSRISGPACVYVGTTCQSAPSITGCTTNGINKEACLVKTTGQCQYQEKCFNSSCERKCVAISDLNQECSPLFNIVQCVSLINQPCIFKNGVCSTFTMNCADYTISSALTILGASKYTSIICSNINIVGLSIIYDSTLKQCKQVTVADLPCNTKLMNKQACLSHTNEFCVYDNTNDQPCTEDSFQVTKHRCFSYMEGNLLTDTCNSNQNWKVCIGIVKASCQFMDNVCSEVPDDATCASLSTTTTLISQFTCQSRTDVACSYDKTNKRCKVVTSKVLTCEEIGLNIVGCLANTTTLLCEWNETTKKCQNGIKQNYKCTDLINVTNCILVNLPGQQCYFYDNKCQAESTSSSQCLSEIQVNAAACAIVTDIACNYDSVNRKCKAATHSEDCITDLTLNEKGCYQNTSDKYCKWFNQKCIAAIDLASLLCQDSVNMKTCTHITNPTELCQYIKPLDGANYCMNIMPTAQQCEQITFVNKPDLCILAYGGPCMYNDVTRSCEILTKTLNVCSEVLNSEACLQKVSVKCEFTDRCRVAGSSSILECSQAISKAQCIVVNKPCKWVGDKCQQIQTPATCVNDLLDISPSVCSGVPSDGLTYCLYDYTKLTCTISKPSSCKIFNSQTSCLKVQTMQCLWMGQQCVDYAPIKGFDECTLFQENATKGVCLGIQKRGQKCEFIGERCQTAKYEDGWQDRVNIGACIGQRLEPCYFENLKCKCPLLTELQSLYKITKCNDKLSYLLCLSIETDGEYCQWTDEVCQSQAAPTTITIASHSQISPNFCRHIIDVAVAYSISSHSCQTLINLDLDCIQPGLNKLGCLFLINPCQWKDGKCIWYLPELHIRRMLTPSQTIIVSGVSISVCFQITQPVQYINGSCVLINEYTKCEDIGVNKYGCLSITLQPCIWQDEQCQYYEPLEPCLEVPKNVNERVCALVDLDYCAYNRTISQCEIPKLLTTQCSAPGLSYKACIFINGCVFNQGKCSYETPGHGCSRAQYANSNVCANAYNSCVYDELRQQCTGLQLEVACDQQGLSEMACGQLTKCKYNRSIKECECKKQVQTFCNELTHYSCNQFPHCIYDDTYCRNRYCDDTKVPNGNSDVMVQACATMPNCYLINQNQCKQALYCEEIVLNKAFYKQCSEIIIQNRPCYPNVDKCKELLCSIMLQKDCNDHDQYCYWDTTNNCVDKRCEHMSTIAECTKQHNCYPYQINSQIKCRYIQKCSDIVSDQGANQSKEDQCNAIQELVGPFKVMAVSPKGVQCGYVDGKCLNSPCRTFGSMEMDCIGKLINNQNVCILDSTYVCQACEEITNSCECLEHEAHCKYDVTTQQCVSITCPSIIDNQQCTLREDCHYQNNVCLTKCQYHFSIWACNRFGCNWSEDSQSCEQCPITTTCDGIEACTNNICCELSGTTCQVKYSFFNIIQCNLESKKSKKCFWNVQTNQCQISDKIERISLLGQPNNIIKPATALIIGVFGLLMLNW